MGIFICGHSSCVGLLETSSAPITCAVPVGSFCQVVIGQIDLGVNATRPEFGGVRFGNTPSSALVDLAGCDASRCVHGTEDAGIIGASNLSDPNPGSYVSLQMNGIVAGLPGYKAGGLSGYILEERNYLNADTMAYLQFVENVIASGARIVLLELQLPAPPPLDSNFQSFNTQESCSFC